MPRIFELFGYPVSDRTPTVEACRSRVFCPFMGAECDGGGNRYMAEISLNSHPELRSFFRNREKIPCGVCSISINENTPPWIICPRRLLYMGKRADTQILLGVTQRQLLDKCGFERGISIGVWSEVKVHYKELSGNNEQEFDYTFDYILMPIGRIRAEDACILSNTPWNKFQNIPIHAGFTLTRIGDSIFVENFPIGYPIIVEVMTSSTSGGNKAKRSSITQAFEDSILGQQHLAPGINYRQVWARMASQLIVKSQAGLAWGGKAIWVLQDTLAQYISSSTALKLNQFISTHIGEVNILAYSYGSNYTNYSDTPITLSESVLYSGPIRSSNGQITASFQDIVLTSIIPPRETLIYAMCKKGLATSFVMP